MPFPPAPEAFKQLLGLAVDPPDWGKLTRAWIAEILEGPMSSWAETLLEAGVAKSGAILFALWVKSQGAIGEAIGGAIDDVEKQAGPSLLKAAAAGLSDYFGTTIEPGELNWHAGFDGRRQLSDRLGRLIFDSMFESFGTATEVTPEQGFENAQSMLGFNLSTALEGWFGGVLTTGYLSKFFPNWADLDSLLQQHLGFGRMNRRIMGPFMDEIITIPLRRHLRRLYQSEIFSETESVRALFRGVTTENEYFDTMALHGWNREKAAQLKVVNGRLLEKEDIQKGFELGVILESELPGIYGSLGYSPELASIMTLVTVEDRIRTINNAVESVARSMFRESEITEPEYRVLLGEAGRSPLEQSRMVALGELERARDLSEPKKIRRVPRGTVERSFREGLLTLGQLTDFYADQGFPSGDIQLMSALQLLLVAKKLPPPPEAAEA